jgi:hypothetical protein
LKAYDVSDGRERDMHTAETLLPEPSSFKVEIVSKKLERYKLLVIYQIHAE